MPLLDFYTYLKLLSAWTFSSAALLCTLILCPVFSWLHSPTPVLLPLSVKLSLPAVTCQPAHLQLSSHVELHLASLFSPLLYLCGFHIIRLGFFPFQRSVEATLQLIKNRTRGELKEITISSALHWLHKRRQAAFTDLHICDWMRRFTCKKCDLWQSWGIMLALSVLSDCQSAAHFLQQGAN